MGRRVRACSSRFGLVARTRLRSPGSRGRAGRRRSPCRPGWHGTHGRLSDRAVRAWFRSVSHLPASLLIQGVVGVVDVDEVVADG